MNKQQWAILGVLGIAVLCFYCVGGLVVLQTLSAPSVSPDSIALQPEARNTLLASPTPLATFTPTTTPTPLPTATWVLASPPTVLPTATWVLAPPPTQAGATVVGTRAPLAPSATPGATSTRRATVQPVGPIMTA